MRIGIARDYIRARPARRRAAWVVGLVAAAAVIAFVVAYWQTVLYCLLSIVGVAFAAVCLVFGNDGEDSIISDDSNSEYWDWGMEGPGWYSKINNVQIYSEDE